MNDLKERRKEGRLALTGLMCEERSVVIAEVKDDFKDRGQRSLKLTKSELGTYIRSAIFLCSKS